MQYMSEIVMYWPLGRVISVGQVIPCQPLVTESLSPRGLVDLFNTWHEIHISSFGENSGLISAFQDVVETVQIGKVE